MALNEETKALLVGKEDEILAAAKKLFDDAPGDFMAEPIVHLTLKIIELCEPKLYPVVTSMLKAAVLFGFKRGVAADEVMQDMTIEALKG